MSNLRSNGRLSKRLAPIALLTVWFGLQPITMAQTPGVEGHTEHNKSPEQIDSTLTWDDLSDLQIEVETPAPLQSIFHVSFPQALRDRDGRTVKIRGFMYPLEAGESHDYFLLSALPPSCPFCLPGGQTTLVEVKCADPIEYTLEPVMVEGQFAILKDDPSGLYYRLTEARAIAE